MRPDRFLSGMLLACTAALPCLALERQEVRFHLAFEKSLTPSVTPGEVTVTVQGATAAEIAFAEGKRGLGVTMQPGRSITIEGKGIFAAREGTIGVWVKPLGWRQGDGLNHYFVRAVGDRIAFLLYKFYPGNTWVYLEGAGKTGVVGGYWDGWEDGQWAFLAFTFKPGEQAWYVNGQLQTRKTDDPIEPDFSARTVLQLSDGSQVLDELVVLGRALTEPEVEALYRANQP
jgi:hypothetical protein